MASSVQRPERRGPLSEDARLILRASILALAVDGEGSTFVPSRLGALRGSLTWLAEHADDPDLNVRVWELKVRIVLDGIGGGAA